MKSIARAAILIGLAATQATAATPDTQQKLRGRVLEGECVDVPNGEWRPSPGCRGAVWCFNDGPFFLYPCPETHRYHEELGVCRPSAMVNCRLEPWGSIADSDAGLEVGPEVNRERKCSTPQERMAFRLCKMQNCKKEDLDCKKKCKQESCSWDD